MERGSFCWKIKTELVCLLKTGNTREKAISIVTDKYQLPSDKVVRSVYDRKIRPQFRQMVEQAGRIDKSVLY